MSGRTRQRFGDLFWHGLTALAFAAVVALMFAMPAHAAATGHGLPAVIDTPASDLTAQRPLSRRA